MNDTVGDTSKNYDQKLKAVGAWLEGMAKDVEAEHAARRLLLDTLACAVAGFRNVDLAYLGDGAGGFALPGADARLGPSEAAYALAVAACADEACEGLAYAHGRPGLHAVAAGVGAALRTGASLEQLLDGIVAGFEIGGRMGGLLRARPGIHVDGTWGLVAATVAARRIFGGNGAALADATTAALCQMPASLYLPVSQGADLRNSYSGHAASAGLLIAASLATGMATPTGAVDAAGGYAFNRDDAAWLGPGRQLILEGYLKPYPAVRHTHYGVEAARAWRRANPNVAPADIGPVTLAIYPEATVYCGNRAPTTPIMGQFSLTYTLAYSLIHGDLTPEAYEPAMLGDVSLKALEASIQIEAVDAFGARGAREARLTVGAGQSAWSMTVDSAPGDASRPLSDAELSDKARAFCHGRLDQARAERLIEEVLEGSGARSVADLLGS